MCVRGVAFFIFLVAFFFDAMVFLLGLDCPNGHSRPSTQIRGHCMSNEAVNQLCWNVDDAMVGFPRRAQPEMTLNKSTSVEKFNAEDTSESRT